MTNVEEVRKQLNKMLYTDVPSSYRMEAEERRQIVAYVCGLLVDQPPKKKKSKKE